MVSLHYCKVAVIKKGENSMKKFKKFFGVTVFTFILCFGSILAFAHQQTDSGSLKVGDTIEFDGDEYVVYKLDDDGAHVNKDGIVPIARFCDHKYVVLPGSTDVYIKIDDNSTKCYIKETYVRNQCSKCGDIILPLKSRSTINHKYSFLGKECKNTVNEEKCPYVKP